MMTIAVMWVLILNFMISKAKMFMMALKLVTLGDDSRAKWQKNYRGSSVQVACGLVQQQQLRIICKRCQIGRQLRNIRCISQGRLLHTRTNSMSTDLWQSWYAAVPRRSAPTANRQMSNTISQANILDEMRLGDD
jgi:hypothetical protein